MSKTLREFYSGDLTVRVSTDIDEEAAAFAAKYRKSNEPERHTMLRFELFDDDGVRLYENFVDPFVHADLYPIHRYSDDVLMSHVVEFVDEAIVMNKRAAHALETRAEPDQASYVSERYVWRRRRGAPTRGIPRGLIHAHEWEENRRSAELGAEHIADIKAAERRASRTRRDPPDPWRTAAEADRNAFRRSFEASVNRHEPRAYSKQAKEAAEAFEVAADAWEEVGDGAKAASRRASADHWHREAFISSHRYLSHGFYLVSDAEARRLSNGMPPRSGRYVHFRLTPWSARPAELHHLELQAGELPDRKRRWSYAVMGLR